MHNRHTEDQRLSIAFVLVCASEMRVYTELFYQTGGLTIIPHPQLPGGSLVEWGPKARRALATLPL